MIHKKAYFVKLVELKILNRINVELKVKTLGVPAVFWVSFKAEHKNLHVWNKTDYFIFENS